MAVDSRTGDDKQVGFIRRLLNTNLSRVAGIVLVLFAIVFIVVILMRDGTKLLEQPVHLNIALLCLSFTIGFWGLLIAVLIWHRILASYGVRQSLRDDLRIYSYSSLPLVLPGGVWGIVSRSVLYQRLGAKGIPVATASIVETLVVGLAAAGLYMASTLVRPDISLWKKPEIGLLFSILALTLIHPRIFNRLVNWALQRTKQEKNGLPLASFNFKALVIWVSVEIIILLIGGMAMFVLLASLTDVSPSMLIPVIASWAVAVAVGNLFFWLPGTPVLRDGAMVLVLTPSQTLPVAVAFVLLVRLWSLASLLLLAGLVWVTLDLPTRLRKNTKATVSTPKRAGNTPGSGK
ncbi:MAG: hypothetical protein A3K41_12695 [Chloroflexi bacterium RIFOXYD12_FULL_57_15]|nr:MAG: hypothetical protein A3K41_12695 [Chloroflexi bacterium RIFOXYD12_FULL_57_15]